MSPVLSARVVDLCVVGYFVELTSSSRSEEHTSELQSRLHLVCRLLLEKKKKKIKKKKNKQQQIQTQNGTGRTLEKWIAVMGGEVEGKDNGKAYNTKCSAVGSGVGELREIVCSYEYGTERSR